MKKIWNKFLMIIMILVNTPLEAFVMIGYQAGAEEVDVEREGEWVKSVKFTFPVKE